MPSFKSQYFENADDLVEAKDIAWAPVSTRKKRLKVVRQFTNMLPTLSEEEREELNRSEIANFGFLYRSALQNETLFSSMTTQTNALLEIVVSTGNAEKDTDYGIKLSKAINENAIHYKGKVNTLWKKVAGEITIAGGCPVTQKEKYGWLPELQPDMFFPPETDLDAENTTYAFNPVDITMKGLKEIKASLKEREEGKSVYRKNVEELIEYLEKQITNQINDSSSHGDEKSRGVRNPECRESVVTIAAWYYYEQKWDKNGNSYVSSTLFTDGTSSIDLKDRGTKEERGSAARIIAYWDKAYESAHDWLQLINVDAEIGGIKNLDTLRGVAELIFPSGVEIEELFNLTLEGDKERAKPRWTITNGADTEEIRKWDHIRDSFAPEGVEPLDFGKGAQNLMTPMQVLLQNAAGIAGSGVSNSGRGGELRQQALERQQNNGVLLSSRASEGFNHLDTLLETMVWRLLVAPTKPGTAGYHDIKAVRSALERQGIPFKDLAKRENGRFLYLKVRAHRTPGGGDRSEQEAIADFMMAMLPQLAPANRPRIMRDAIAIRTQNPDLADAAVTLPRTIINAQKVTAENEFELIRRRAAIGQIISVGADDINQDHVPIHLLDMQCLIGQNAVEPWKKLDVLQFSGLVEHTAEHLQILLGNPVTNGEAKIFLRDFQMLAQQAQRIAAEVEEREGSETAQLTPKEQADLELKFMDYQLKAAALGIKAEDYKQLWENRNSRERISARSQYAKEVNEANRLELDAERVKIQEKSAEKAAQKPPAKKKPKG